MMTRNVQNVLMIMQIFSLQVVCPVPCDYLGGFVC